MASEQHHYLKRDALNKPVTVETGRRHVFHLPRLPALHVRIQIDPKKPSSWDDRFVLEMSWKGKRLKQTKTVRDDKIDGDDFVDLVFTRCKEDATYSLKIDPGSEGSPYFMFRDVPYSELFSE